MQLDHCLRRPGGGGLCLDLPLLQPCASIGGFSCTESVSSHCISPFFLDGCISECRCFCNSGSGSTTTGAWGGGARMRSRLPAGPGRPRHEGPAVRCAVLHPVHAGREALRSGRCQLCPTRDVAGDPLLHQSHLGFPSEFHWNAGPIRILFKHLMSVFFLDRMYRHVHSSRTRILIVTMN